MKNVLFIDPFVKEPVLNCFNSLQENFNIKLYLAQPAVMPLTKIKIPSSLDAIIISGSATHVNDHLIWHKELFDLTWKYTNQGVPLLGCCFGHQLVNYYLGGTVDFYHSNEAKLSGSRKIEYKNYLWSVGVTHRQVIKKLAQGLIELGQCELTYDFVKHEKLNYIGFQSHPEASKFFLENDCAIEDQSMIDQCFHSGKEILTLFINKEFFKEN